MFKPRTLNLAYPIVKNNSKLRYNINWNFRGDPKKAPCIRKNACRKRFCRFGQKIFRCQIWLPFHFNIKVLKCQKTLFGVFFTFYKLDSVYMFGDSFASPPVLFKLWSWWARCLVINHLRNVPFHQTKNDLEYLLRPRQQLSNRTDVSK